MNEGLGLPLSFYNRMTELWKNGFNLLFPLYHLTIVVVLIILRNFCIRHSNIIAHFSIQVHIAIIYVSFSKSVLDVINVFTSAETYCANTA